MKDPLTRGVDRQTFIARVRRAVAAVPAGDELQPAPERVADPRSQDELVTQFETEAMAADATVERADSIAAAREQIAGFLLGRNCDVVVRGDTPLMQSLDLDPALHDVGISVFVAGPDALKSREGLRAVTERAPVGLTEADWAISETGTLVLLHRPGQGRAVSLLPTVHLAILPVSRVMPDIGAVLGRLGPGNLPSALTFVTGPSRTADIEMVITKGVHGPAELHVILLDDSG